MSEDQRKIVTLGLDSDVNEDGHIIVQFLLDADILADLMMAIADERKMMTSMIGIPVSATADRLGSELITEAALRAFEAGLPAPQKVHDWLITSALEADLSTEDTE